MVIDWDCTSNSSSKCSLEFFAAGKGAEKSLIDLQGNTFGTSSNCLIYPTTDTKSDSLNEVLTRASALKRVFF